MIDEGPEVLVDQIRGKRVAGVDRGVGGEDGALRDVLRAGLEIGACQLHSQPRRFERCEGAVTLVQVHDAPVDAARAERANATDAEQELLTDADSLVAEIEPRGELAILVAVTIEIAVE